MSEEKLVYRGSFSIDISEILSSLPEDVLESELLRRKGANRILYVDEDTSEVLSEISSEDIMLEFSSRMGVEEGVSGEWIFFEDDDLELEI